MGRRTANMLSLMLMGILAALAAWAAEPGNPAGPSQNKPITKSPAATITKTSAPADSHLMVEHARKRVVLRGYTRAAESIALTAEVGGKVKAVNYEVGEAVTNAPFIEIDTTFIDLSIESAARRLEGLEAARKRAVSSAGYLEKEFRRVNSLHKQGRTSASRYDAAEQQLSQARLELSSVTAEHGALEVSLRELREKRRRHDISPQKGWVITGRMTEPGEVVAPGQPLGKASDFSGMVVPLTVSLREYEALASMGNSTAATLEGRPVAVRLSWQNPDFDERTRKSAVEIAILNSAGVSPRGGLTLELPLMVRTEGLMVPREAVSWRYENPRVTLVETGEDVPLIVVDESAGGLVVADDGRLRPGDALLPAGSPAK